MHSLYVLISLFLLTGCISYGQQSIDNETAKKVAVSWMASKGHKRSPDAKNSYTNIDLAMGKTFTFYVINFTEGGFVVVPSTKNVIPVLAYHHQFASTKEQLGEGSLFMLESYHNAITIHISKNVAMETAKEQWNTFSRSQTFNCTGQSSPYPSLLEHYRTSRWAGWSDSIYSRVTPYMTQIHPNPTESPGKNTCVPTAMAQICRYYRHPFVGSGSAQHTISGGPANGQVASSTFSNVAFDYDLMPFRIQKQGPIDGYPPGTPGMWDYFLPLGCDEMKEIGYLSWNMGVACGMNWYSGGTYGNTSNWANKMVTHFGYTWNPSVDYISFSTQTPANFKAALRNSILAEHPVLAMGLRPDNAGGHCFLYSGFECDNYFYANYGRGGGSDGFYYLFIADSVGTYQSMQYPNAQNCATNLVPVCNLPTYYQVPTTSYATGLIKVEQALIDLTVSGTNSTVTVSNGSELFFIGGHSVTLNPGTEVVLGGIAHVSIENCSGPEGP